MQSETEHVIGQLVSSGVDPFMLAKTLSIPLSVIHQTAITFDTGQVITAPEDASIAEEYRRLELKAIRKAHEYINTLPPSICIRLIGPLLRSAGSRVGKSGEGEGEGQVKKALEDLFSAMSTLPKAVGE